LAGWLVGWLFDGCLMVGYLKITFINICIYYAYCSFSDG